MQMKQITGVYMARLTKIETVDFSGTKRIKAPLPRLLWYFVTLGKWGERYHYKHVPMRRYFSVMDKRLTININANARPFMRAMDEIRTFNCRCSTIKVKLK